MVRLPIPRHLRVSKFDRAVLRTPIEHDHEVPVIQQVHTDVVVHSSRVFRTFGLDGRRILHNHNAPRIVIVIGIERLRQGVAV